MVKKNLEDLQAGGLYFREAHGDALGVRLLWPWVPRPDTPKKKDSNHKKSFPSHPVRRTWQSLQSSSPRCR